MRASGIPRPPDSVYGEIGPGRIVPLPAPGACQRPPIIAAVAARATIQLRSPDPAVGLDHAREDGRVIYYRLATNFPESLLEHCLRELVQLSRAVQNLGGEEG